MTYCINLTAMKSLIKVNIADDKTAFIVCNYEPQKKLRTLLIDINQCEAYLGCATDIDLRSQAANIRMNFNDFISLSTKALTQKETDDHQFLYSFERSYDGDYIFKWKSIDSDETIITIGCLKMKKEDYAIVIEEGFSMLSEELLSLNKRLLDVETNLNNAEKEKTNALELLSNVLNARDNLEKELYSKFVLVLNEKKRKIREVKQGGDNRMPEKGIAMKRKSRNVHHQISDSSDEVDGRLEDIDVPGPSKAKHDNSLSFFDDDEPSLPATPSKMRKRNTTKATVSNNFQELKSDTKARPVIKDSESEDELFKDL